MLRNLLLAFVLLAFSAEANALGIRKFPGETAVFTWDFVVADESKITNFRLYSGPTSSGPFSFTGTTALPASRTLSLPVTFPPGGVFVFYTLRAVYISGTSIAESIDSNAVEVDLNVPTPTGFLAK